MPASLKEAMATAVLEFDVNMMRPFEEAILCISKMEPLGPARAEKMERLVDRLLGPVFDGELFSHLVRHFGKQTLAIRVYGKYGRPSLIELRRLSDSSWEALETLDSNQLRDLGNRLLKLFERTHRILEPYLAESNKFTASGYLVSSAPRLGPAIHEIERLRAAVTNDWPWPDRPSSEG
jgi:hypothetical protein